MLVLQYFKHINRINEGKQKFNVRPETAGNNEIKYV